MNLIDNAIQYSDASTTIVIRMLDGFPLGSRHAVKPTTQELRIANIGLPIPRSDRNRIFERHYRVPAAATKRADGTGLGLFIVKRIAELHGALVSVVPTADERKTEIAFKVPMLS